MYRKVVTHLTSFISAAMRKPKKNGKKDELCIGMEFSFDETAHIAYSEHACNHGFNVRKQRRSKKEEDKNVAKILYVCSKEWVRNEHKIKRSYTQPITKCGCKAHIAVKRSYTQPITNGKYKIVSIEPNHNHNLVKTPMKHLLKGNRAVNISQKRHADNAEMSGILAKATVNMMNLKVGGRENQDSWRKTLAITYTVRNGIKEKDNSSLFYSMQLDENDMITNIFWEDDRSINYYNPFGDVVCFDTTDKNNDYDRPFVPGVNHYKEIAVFGDALLYNETIESFK
ncbi:hypothetical protein N665_1022s0004 [Sinapis alba]|nr:hypothetical protein N665_1022s0004 [Sinapis alba]